ncbi:hypothetical protein Fcan01_16229 [Folsomia candida]|uniref:DDE Tnp4 domain-containing protein n=1 Tax=Folsomia candida TaxID=158441 RepID=A0A226DUC6_FOLCA|nr:hypothetical protein Fcan01_16229 [Folsomia candida]
MTSLMKTNPAPQRKPLCYICHTACPASTMKKLEGNHMNHFREIAEDQRMKRTPDGDRVEAIDPAVDRLCLSCYSAVSNLIENQKWPARVDVFIKREIFIPEGSRLCKDHMGEDGKLLSFLVQGLQGQRRTIKLSPIEIQRWFSVLRTNAIRNQAPDYNDENTIADNDFFTITSLSKDQFRNLYELCGPVQVSGHDRIVYKIDLIMFLCKLRQGIPDEFLKAIFHYSTRQAVSLAVNKVRESLMRAFVRTNLGPDSMTRQQFIHRHVSDFANQLYNPNPEKPQAILCIDGTYIEIATSSNFRIARQSYCMHKSYHLVKPIMIVAPDGYIFDVHGPYFSDSKNNDAKILIDELQRDIRGFGQWIQEGDIVIVDYGYRESIPTLQRLGIRAKIPNIVRGRATRDQLPTEEANNNRLITKSRWVVEARNGHLKSVFKFFAHRVESHNCVHLGDLVRIACALLNAFHLPITMPGYNADEAKEMLRIAAQPNHLMQRVHDERLETRAPTQWFPMTSDHLPAFPHLSLQYLRDLTFGKYQVKLAPAYVQDKNTRDGEYRFDLSRESPGLLRAQVYSRHTRAAKYQLWIQFHEVPFEEALAGEQLPHPLPNPIQGWYCQCKTGARTLGTCSHIASVLWFMGWARHQDKLQAPSHSLLGIIDDAAHRDAPELFDDADDN